MTSTRSDIDPRAALDPPAAAQLGAVERLVRDVLGETALAAYLHGSAVRGGLQADSDLDVLVVVSRRTTADQRRALIQGLLDRSRSPGRADGARHLEVTVVDHAAVRPWRYPPAMEFQYGDWWRREFQAGDLAPWVSPNPDLAVVLTAVRTEGWALFGPPAADLLDPVPRGDLELALREVVPGLLAELVDDTRNVLLTLARIRVTLETGTIVPKDEAADWALARLPADRGDALRRARAGYLGETLDTWEDEASLASALADAAAMVEAIQR